MPRIKDGFKGERAIVLPAFLIEELKQDPLEIGRASCRERV